jgi:hypothetical protein
VGASTKIDVYDVAPPTRVGQPSATGGMTTGTLTAHAAAWIEMTQAELANMEVWLSDVRDRLAARPARSRWDDYSVIPAAREIRDASTGRVVHVRYSCAGFVERCYAQGAAIDLMVDEDELPAVDLATLARIWPAVLHHRRRRFGLEGEGPWKVLLPGYLLHSLARLNARVPYRPQPGDAAF